MFSLIFGFNESFYINSIKKFENNSFGCDFEDYCGFVNHPQLLYNFERVDYFPFLLKDIISGKGFMLLDLVWSEWRREAGARLISPYFPDLDQTDSCLHLKFLSWGHGVIHLVITQQDITNRCIWYYDNQNFDLLNPNKYWTTVQIPVTLSGHSPRFFIETQIYFYKIGFVAIDEFRLFYQKCQMPYNIGNKPGNSTICPLNKII